MSKASILREKLESKIKRYSIFWQS